MWRRGLGALLTIAGLFVHQSAWAQYPTKPVHIVVPYPAGGAVDAFARVLSQRLSDSWGQQVVVDNRPGASTMIGADQADNVLGILSVPIEAARVLPDRAGHPRYVIGTMRGG